MNLEAGTSFFMAFEPIILRRLGLPAVIWGTSMFEPLSSDIINHQPNDLSPCLPFLNFNVEGAHNYGHSILSIRAYSLAVHILIDQFYNKFMFAPAQFRSSWDELEASRITEGTVLTDGLLGYREILSEPPNVHQIMPPLRMASKFYHTRYLDLPSEYSNFLSRFPRGNVLVAFGTTWMPEFESFKQVVEAMRELPEIGFVVSLQEFWQHYQYTIDLGLPNVMVKNFVPQKELLNDARLMAFMSHGGGNSVSEAIYYGKPIIGFPIAIDQPGSCYRIERLQIGISLRLNPTKEKALDAIN